jgi:hypothetical protein
MACTVLVRPHVGLWTRCLVTVHMGVDDP